MVSMRAFAVRGRRVCWTVGQPSQSRRQRQQHKRTKLANSKMRMPSEPKRKCIRRTLWKCKWQRGTIFRGTAHQLRVEHAKSRHFYGLSQIRKCVCDCALTLNSFFVVPFSRFGIECMYTHTNCASVRMYSPLTSTSWCETATLVTHTHTRARVHVLKWMWRRFVSRTNDINISSRSVRRILISIFLLFIRGTDGCPGHNSKRAKARSFECASISNPAIRMKCDFISVRWLTWKPKYPCLRNDKIIQCTLALESVNAAFRFSISTDSLAPNILLLASLLLRSFDFLISSHRRNGGKNRFTFDYKLAGSSYFSPLTPRARCSIMLWYFVYSRVCVCIVMANNISSTIFFFFLWIPLCACHSSFRLRRETCSPEQVYRLFNYLMRKTRNRTSILSSISFLLPLGSRRRSGARPYRIGSLAHSSSALSYNENHTFTERCFNRKQGSEWTSEYLVVLTHQKCVLHDYYIFNILAGLLAHHGSVWLHSFHNSFRLSFFFCFHTLDIFLYINWMLANRRRHTHTLARFQRTTHIPI